MLMRSEQKVERRKCFKCQEFGYIAWNCPKSKTTKHGVTSNSGLKHKCADKNSTFKIGENSKSFYKRKFDLNKQR
ncbi:putative transcription factor interactor and regulator CCHC(Zn) family [Helianthus anomalus]